MPASAGRDANKTRAVVVASLSATGSKNAPNGVHTPHARARAPSRASVTEAPAKMEAVMRGAVFGGARNQAEGRRGGRLLLSHPSSRLWRPSTHTFPVTQHSPNASSGTAATRASVSTVGRVRRGGGSARALAAAGGGHRRVARGRHAGRYERADGRVERIVSRQGKNEASCCGKKKRNADTSGGIHARSWASARLPQALLG